MGSNERRFKRNIHQAIWIAVGCVLLIAAFFYIREIEHKRTFFYTQFKNPDGSLSIAYQLEIARTGAERAKGLMFRKELAKDSGMVFIYPQEDIHKFWMQNTYIPLDMIFLDKDWKVVGILADVPILNTEQRFVDSKSKATIELLAGSAKEQGIKVGSTLLFEGNAPNTNQ